MPPGSAGRIPDRASRDRSRMADIEHPNPPSATDPTSTPGGTALADPPAAGPRSGIDRLTKMSTTAGLGSGDYAAVNTLAVAALAAAVVGALAALLSGVLIVIPVVALVVAAVALRQIRDSNGTQAGRRLALLAVLVSVGVLGYVIGAWALNEVRTRPDRQQILAVVAEFDKAMAAKDHGAAYQLTTPAFRRRVAEPVWRETFATFEAVPEFGGVAGAAWNGVPIIFEQDPESQLRQAAINVLFKYRKGGEPTRVTMGFTHADGKWLINDMPMLFRREPAGQTGQQQQQRR